MYAIRSYYDNEVFELKEELLSGILTVGGTILGTSRLKPFKHHSDDRDEDRNNFV